MKKLTLAFYIGCLITVLIAYLYSGWSYSFCNHVLYTMTLSLCGLWFWYHNRDVQYIFIGMLFIYFCMQISLMFNWHPRIWNIIDSPISCPCQRPLYTMYN